METRQKAYIHVQARAATSCRLTVSMGENPFVRLRPWNRPNTFLTPTVEYPHGITRLYQKYAFGIELDLLGT